MSQNEVSGRSEQMVKTSSIDPAQALHDAIAGNKATAAEDILDEATLLHIPGRSGLAGQYQGREAILGLLRRMTELTEATLRFAPARTLTADDQMIVLYGRSSASRQAKRLDTETAYVAWLRDGRVREIWIAHRDQAQFDNLWS
jgi:ketosteroid isomerase-like protein